VTRRTRAYAATFALAALGTGCGSDGTAAHAGETLDGGLGASSPGLVLAQRANQLVQQNHDAECALCPACGGFSPGSDSCEGALLDAYSQAKQNVVCRIAADERRQRCLADAKTCNDATQCDASANGEYATCPTFTGPTTPPPTGC
jgi:hypothetical protein